MMQVTRAAFQAVASLNEQATDPKSHTSVKNSLLEILPRRYLQIPMVDPEGRLRRWKIKLVCCND